MDVSQKTDLFSPLASQDELGADDFPCLNNLSAAFVYQYLPVPIEPLPAAEYVHVPIDPNDNGTIGWLFKWNVAWEASPKRFHMFDEHDVPEHLRWLDRLEGHNICLVPNVQADPYTAYAPLYHLLLLDTLRRFGLPALRRGTWPPMPPPLVGQPLSADFKERLSKAVAFHLWPYLSGSCRSAFSNREPTVVLAHSLDFWLPYADRVAQDRMRALGRVKFKDEEQERRVAELQEHARQNDRDCIPQPPLFGGDVWRGQEEALAATEEMLDHADHDGRLRAILETVRSNRVVDDFSPCWSFARKDFERKLYKKRSKVKVTFVELEDTIPVHGPDAEVEADRIWQDLFALADVRERKVIVCLRSGVTKVGDIAKDLGYANHSPVSKALDRIRKKASRLLH